MIYAEKREECESYDQTTAAETEAVTDEEDIQSKRRPKKKWMEDYVSGNGMLFLFTFDHAFTLTQGTNLK